MSSRRIVVSPDKPGPFVAIVDDEESICRALLRLLRAAGVEAVAYSSGAQFLDSLKTTRPGCVVLDIHMPHVSGFDVQAYASQMRPPLPVIAMTGRHREETRLAVIAAGAVAYLCKPVDEHALLDAVAAAIGAGELGDRRTSSDS